MDDGTRLPFSKLTLVYAENGRGKTTLAAILRSLGSGAPLPIAERHRLSAEYPPHVVMDPGGGAQLVTFQNGVWSQNLGEIAVFDDAFIDQNVYSGLTVEADHRQNLHELILGSEGIALNNALQEAVERIEEHNRALKAKGDAIPVTVRSGMDADAF
jgi:wobble nucleotide-excising tRNase